MGKRLLPDKTADSIFSLDLQALSSRGIRGIIFDIDNTLESHRVPEPSARVCTFLDRVQNAGFRVCLISNGKKNRVERFNSRLHLPAIARAGKPLKKNLRRALTFLNTSPEETALVGDQIFTDVYGGNRMGFYTILVNPIEQIENKFFYIKRFLERMIRKKIKE